LEGVSGGTRETVGEDSAYLHLLEPF
jgi:hypothetical protein